jgi:hypothetical protein
MDGRCFSRPNVARGVPAAIGLAIILLALVSARVFYDRAGLEREPYEYNIAAWELRHLLNKWLFLLGEPLREDLTETEQDQVIVRFFQLSAEIEALEQRDAPSGDTPDAKRRERDRLENQVEATLERRISTIAAEQGIERSLPLFGRFVWPPVDFEFTISPRTLVISPRERIELKDTSLLREGLPPKTVDAIENETAARDNVSALSFPTGGVGAYPAIVAYPRSYRAAVETAAHEWMHNYLFFRPLGIRYYDSNDLRTMNETVADLVGHEIADAVTARWPITEAPQPPMPPQTSGVDLGAALRALRGEVEALLAPGRVTEAEALMEQRRRELVAQGFPIRKLNQAYFAFTNLYAGEAGDPSATNPIGPKIDELRRRSATLRRFVDIAGDLTSVSDLDAALAALD